LDPEDIHILITEILLLSSSGLPSEARYLRESHNYYWAFKNPVLFLDYQLMADGDSQLSRLPQIIDSERMNRIRSIITNNRAQALTSPVKWIRDWAAEQSNMG